LNPTKRVARVPPYAQIKQHIIDRIERGEWKTGSRLPSEKELVAAFGVARMTVHRALRELSAEGVLSRFQGVGTFLSPPDTRFEVFRAQDIDADIISRGHEHRAKLITLQAVRANPDLASAFTLRPGAKLFHSVVVHCEDDAPVMLEERYVTPAWAPKYLEQDFTKHNTGRYLLSLGPPSELDHSIFAVSPDKRTQKLLEIDENEPCLLLIRWAWHGGPPTTKSLFAYPGSRYSLGSRYKLSEDANRRILTTTIPK